MKNIILVLIFVFIFIGCSVKQEIILSDENKAIESSESLEPKIIIEKIEDIKDDIVISKDDTDDERYKIAVVYPSKLIGKYAKTSLDTVIGYFLYRDIKINIETFDSFNQDAENIKNAFDKIKEKEFNAVIALYPNSSLEKIYNLDNHDSSKIYFPLISSDETFLRKDNYIYGAISYKNQIKKLINLSNDINYTFYEKSFIGNKLNNIYQNNTYNIKGTKFIKRKSSNFKYLVKDKRLNNSTLMLNTPMIKSSIILSQLRVYDIEPKIILSTQLNYNPLIVSLTQYEDRINLITANSIEDVNSNLEETLNLLGIDIKYNWVNYSILVGINYLYDANKENIIINEIINNEVIYNTKFYKSTRNGFKEIKE